MTKLWFRPCSAFLAVIMLSRRAVLTIMPTVAMILSKSTDRGRAFAAGRKLHTYEWAGFCVAVPSKSIVMPVLLSGPYSRSFCMKSMRGLIAVMALAFFAGCGKTTEKVTVPSDPAGTVSTVVNSVADDKAGAKSDE